MLGKNTPHLISDVLLGSIDPDDVQMAVIDALFILVGITGAALRSGLWFRRVRILSSRDSTRVQLRAGSRQTSGADLGYDPSITPQHTLYYTGNTLQY